MPAVLKKILEMNVAELRDWMLINKGEPQEQCYAAILYHYLVADVGRLESSLSDASGVIKLLGEARLKLRQANVSSHDVENLLCDLSSMSPPWRGEVLFVGAMLWECLGDDRRASDAYRMASAEFESDGLKHKSVKALQNHVAAESRLHKERRFLIEYTHLYRVARRVGEKQVAGVALNNLSREYQTLGALKTALKFSTKSVALLQNDFGGLHYEHALAHRCHLLLEMGREQEAEQLLEQIRVSRFPEILAAYAVIQELRVGRQSKPAASDFVPLDKTWRDRRAAGYIKQKHKFPALEEQLIALLIAGPKDKFDIVQALYGSKVDPEAADNRLKNLLSRVRKKFPGLIVLSDSKYKVIDPEFLPDELKKSS